MSAEFVHLHVHTEFSLSDGIVRAQPLVKQCVAHNQPALAITDLSNLFGLVKFYRACVVSGIKPVVGCDVWIQPHQEDARLDRLTMLCLDDCGYLNLCNLLTQAYICRNRHEKAAIPWHELVGRHEGLICLMDEHQGPLAGLGDSASLEDITETITRYQKLFGENLYLSVSRIGKPGEEAYIRRAAVAAMRHGLGLVATNRVVYLHAEDFEAHEIRVCINNGRVLDDPRRPRDYTGMQYLRSSEEMDELFSDMPVAIRNSVEIARRCNVFLNFEDNHLPAFPGIGEHASEGECLRELAEYGLMRRLSVDVLRHPDGTPAVDPSYLDRLEMELGVILEMGYAGYFLIVADFIGWSRDHGIPVGPGRGSGAGSLVAWATGITELDPLDYGLIFERFLNPERVSLPDFDIDFCVDGRDRVIEYVAERYGQEQVAQIITFGTMAAKAVVRDVGRVMGHSYGFVDKIAKLIPFEVGMTLEKALSQEELLKSRYEEDLEVQTLVDMALQLEGIARNAGKHAGGVVIAPRPLIEYTPLYTDTYLGQPITQFDKDDLESIGLVKFDFLGLRTLTIIDHAVSMVNMEREGEGLPPIDLEKLPLDDAPTYEFIQSGNTVALFQLESRGMQQLIVKASPQVFEDLVALIAMFRPGPLKSGMVDDFINRKAGQEEICYLHSDLEPILDTTYGVILYQEQVMKIAQSLAGYTLGQADLLRKAMGKKLPEEMAKQSKTFITGAVERGVKKHIAENIFNLMDKFAGYGFNKSHSAAYALLSYQTAWLKTHYPAAFLAAALSAELDNTEKVVILLDNCRLMGIGVRPPRINESHYAFKVCGEREIFYGLGAIKGVGKNVIEAVVSARENGCFTDLFDFCKRMDPRFLNKRIVEAFIKSGAMDDIGSNRATMMESTAVALQAVDQQKRDHSSGQFDMFGVDDSSIAHPVEDCTLEEWSEEDRLIGEKQVLGLYLSGHPYNQYKTEFRNINPRNIEDLDLSKPRNGVFAGIVVTIRTNITRRGKMAFVVLDNAANRVELRLNSDQCTAYHDKLKEDALLIAVGELSRDELTGNCQMRVSKLFSIEEIRAECLGGLVLAWQEQNLEDGSVNTLKDLLRDFRGGSTQMEVRFTRREGESGMIRFSDSWRISPDGGLIAELKRLYGEDAVIFNYERPRLEQHYRGTRQNHASGFAVNQ